MWALISVTSIVSPFYSAYVPFVNFLVRGKHLEDRTTMKVITVFPFVIFLNMFIDCFFLIQGLVYPSIIFVINLIPRLLGLLVFMLAYFCDTEVKNRAFKLFEDGIMSTKHLEKLYDDFNLKVFGM